MINLSLPQDDMQMRPRITVIGVGGAGGNAVNNMIKANLEGVEFVVANTDAQALNGSLAQKRIQLGVTITRGLGAGSRPDVGRAAAEEQIEDVMTHLEGANMVFITAGMGGGTGTGAAPVIARTAREQGILTVGVVTKPFHFEGAHRMRLAESGIAELQQYVDTLIIIPNQNLFRIANEKTTFADAFKMADDVLHSGVRGVTDLMVMPGLINLDFADIRSVMTEMGKAMMGTGEATGDRRAIDAAEAAISNPLLDDVSMKGARGVLINITGGYDMTLFEVDEAANRIRDEVDPDANIIFGSTFDSSLEGRMRVSVVATGIDAAAIQRPLPQAQQPQPTPANAAPMGGRKPGAPAAGPARPDQPSYHATMVQAPLAPSAVPMSGPMAANAMAQGVPVTTTATARQLDLDPQMSMPPLAQAEPAAVVEAAPASADVREALARVEPKAYDEMSAQAQMARGSGATGPLRGERRDGMFVPPRPADPGPRPQVASSVDGLTAGPVGSHQMGDDKPRKRAPSLFEKMTGLGTAARRFLTDTGEHDLQPPRPAAPAPKAAPMARPQAPASAAAQQQGRLGIENQGPNKISPAEEDVLDIPAFLRRQAN